MTFDKKWETKIYKQGKQINQYPYDLIVSFVNKYYKRNNLKSKNKKALDLGCGTGNNLKFIPLAELILKIERNKLIDRLILINDYEYKLLQNLIRDRSESLLIYFF